MDIHLLAMELILERLEPIHLLNCRLVNRLWCGMATDLLNRVGWTVWLRTPERCLEYLEATGVSQCKSRKRMPKMNLGLVATSATLKNKFANQVSFTLTRTMFQRLTFTLSVLENIPPKLLKFLSRNAESLREIAIYFIDSRNEGSRKEEPFLEDLEFPSLKSVQLCLGPKPDFELGPSARKLIEELMERAPNLTRFELIRRYRGEPSTIWKNLGGRLRKISSVDISEVLHGKSKITVQTLRLPVPYTHDWQMCSHFGIRLASLLQSKNSTWIRPRALTRIKATLRLMQEFPNLTSVSTNLEACTAAAKLFTYNGGNFVSGQVYVVPPLFEKAIWPKVTSLNLSVAHSALSIYKQECRPRLGQLTAWLITKMFPNLQELIVILGTDSKTNCEPELDFEYVINILRHVRVPHVEIRNWGLGWELQLGQGQGQGQATSAAAALLTKNCRNPTWKCFTLCGPKKKSMEDGEGSGAKRDKPRLWLHRLIGLIPAGEGTNYVVRIDVNILRGHREPIEELLERLSAIRNPRAELL